MKYLCGLLFAVSLVAQTTKTVVTDTIYDAGGQKVTGSCIYQAVSRFVGVAGSQVVGERVTISIRAGVFSASLVPTDTASPGPGYYTVTCSGLRGWAESGTWLVATSVTPLKWSDIWRAVPPTWAQLKNITWSQLK